MVGTAASSSFGEVRICGRHPCAWRGAGGSEVSIGERACLADGHVVAFETRTTPAKGRELTFLQQLFNATPGVPIGTLAPNGGQGAPGSGGGPGP